jgi:hypothetical protein
MVQYVFMTVAEGFRNQPEQIEPAEADFEAEAKEDESGPAETTVTSLGNVLSPDTAGPVTEPLPLGNISWPVDRTKPGAMTQALDKAADAAAHEIGHQVSAVGIGLRRIFELFTDKLPEPRRDPEDDVDS